MHVMHTYAQYIWQTYVQRVPITKQYALQESRPQLTDQIDMTSHMPQTFDICRTCAPRQKIYFALLII